MAVTEIARLKLDASDFRKNLKELNSRIEELEGNLKGAQGAADKFTLPQGFADLSSTLEGLPGALGNVGGGLSSLTGSLTAMANPATVAAAAIAGIGVATVAALEHTIDLTHEMGQMAAAAGVSIEEFSRYRVLMRDAGIDTDDMRDAIAEVSAKLQDARDPTSSQAEAFRDLGLSVEELLAQDPATQFDTVARTIADMGDVSAQTATAMAIFGDDVALRLLPILREGSGEFDALKAKAEDLGLVLGEEAAQDVEEYRERIGDLESSMSALATQIGAALVPALNAVLDLFTETSEEVQLAPFIAEIRGEFEAAGGASEELRREFSALKLEMGVISTSDQEIYEAMARRRLEAAQAAKVEASERAKAARDAAQAESDALELAAEAQQAHLEAVKARGSELRAQQQEISQNLRASMAEIEAMLKGASDALASYVTEGLGDVSGSLDEFGAGLQTDVENIQGALEEMHEGLADSTAAQVQRELDAVRRAEREKLRIRMATLDQINGLVQAAGDFASEILRQQGDEVNRAAKVAFGIQQAAALASIGIDTAVGVMKAIAMFGPPPSPAGIAAIALTLATGAAAAATVLAQTVGGYQQMSAPPSGGASNAGTVTGSAQGSTAESSMGDGGSYGLTSTKPNQNVNDTPGMMRAGPWGATVDVAPYDYYEAARDPRNMGQAGFSDSRMVGELEQIRFAILTLIDRYNLGLEIMGQMVSQAPMTRAGVV